MTQIARPALHRPKILVVDPDAAQRELLGRWLTHTGYEPHPAADGLEAIALLQSERFEAVVTELALPRLNGLQLLSMLKELDAGLPVIFFATRATTDEIIEALREGKAFDFLLKPLRDLSVLNGAIERARARRQPAPPAIAPLRPKAAPRALPDHVEALTAQETRLVGLLAQGMDNRHIADALHFSEKTIRNYLSRIYEKLAVSNRLQAVVFCQEHGLLAQEVA